MKLNLTIELPLKNPNEVLDMAKVHEVLDSNFVNTINDNQPFRNLSDRPTTELSNQAYFISTVIQKSVQEISQSIQSIKYKYAEPVDFDPSFPPSVVQEAPDLPKHWKALRSDFNGLREATLNLFQLISPLTDSAGDLKDMFQEIFAKGFPEIEQLKAKVAQLQDEVVRNQVQAQVVLRRAVEAHEADVAQFRIKMHEKDKLFNVKERRAAVLEKELETMGRELTTVQEALVDTTTQVSNKYSDFQELNKYIGELFKDKRKFVALVQEKDGLITKLQDEVRELKEKEAIRLGIGQKTEEREALRVSAAREASARQISLTESQLRDERTVAGGVGERLDLSRLEAAQPSLRERERDPQRAIGGALEKESNRWSTSKDQLLAGDLSAIYHDKMSDWLRGGLLKESVVPVDMSRIYRDKISEILGSNRRLLDKSQFIP
jgi:FtsZ-binding cell division protein ZapB